MSSSEQAAFAAFRAAVPDDADHASLLLVDERREEVGVRRGVPEPWHERRDRGVLVTVHAEGGQGYASTADLREEAIAEAVERATWWARATAARAIYDTRSFKPPAPTAAWSTSPQRPAAAVPLPDKLALLTGLSERLHRDPRIVDWYASLWAVDRRAVFVSADGEREQMVQLLCPGLGVVADNGEESVVRSIGDRGRCVQGGFEDLDFTRVTELPEHLATEALMLLDAPDCPTGTMDVLLAPDQMMLQIHESIGHPLELDRILGDERNYAGTSFVTLEMFGSFQYGSPLLNVSFDNGLEREMASYGFDDTGLDVERTLLIEDGVLMRPIGGTLSAARAGRPDPNACNRVTSWNRPAIDRMANLNIEPGTTTREAMIAGCERGVLMETNSSWSIDDSRNKFQFGCEIGHLIEDGQVKGVVKKPNYRGVSSSFWRNLIAVGDEETFEILGTPHCGKGEPNQVIRVGHASPLCRFADVEVFGGD